MQFSKLIQCGKNMLTFVQLYEDSQLLLYFRSLEIQCIDFKIEFVLFLSSGQEGEKLFIDMKEREH